MNIVNKKYLREALGTDEDEREWREQIESCQSSEVENDS